MKRIFFYRVEKAGEGNCPCESSGLANSKHRNTFHTKMTNSKTIKDRILKFTGCLEEIKIPQYIKFQGKILNINKVIRTKCKNVSIGLKILPVG